MSGGVINWISQKEATVTLTTAKGEYAALGSAMQEAIWLCWLMSDVNVSQVKSTVIQKDSHKVQ